MDPTCVRKVSNFGAVKKHHLIDSGSFNKDLFNLEVPIASPKLVALMDQIAELDLEDMKEHGEQFKHMIFTDINSPAYGYKIIASAMIARDYEPCFEPKGTGFHLKDDEDLLRTKDKNFAVLASKPMYGRIFHVAFKKKLLLKFNERDANVNGPLIRFIIVDQGFKEGIDLFDVKYVHLFEPVLPADEKQAIGRSTRFCGQTGLNFIPTLGWPLHVYKYDNDLSFGKFDFETSKAMWIDALNLDLTQIAFSNSLNEATIDAAVDKELTAAIHTFSVGNAAKASNAKKTSKTSKTSQVALKVSKKATKSSKASQSGGAKRSATRKKSHLPTPPTRKLGKDAMHAYIDEHFGEFRYPKAKLENKCIRSEAQKAADDVDVSRIITFTPTQDFARHFFTPASPYKGILFYHSVGTGKLCSGIATATSSFDKEGYTLLWVTRHTLKADFWKNMIGQICNIATREKVVSGEMKMPALNASKRTVIGPNWIEPISYKQFTNLLTRENKYYNMLVERNGVDDPLRKTLLIVDECHKLYSDNVAASESPDMDEFEKWIQNSYEISGKDSVRIVLMSGTPYTDDAMELIQLINLMKEESDHMPVDFSDFADQYLDKSGNFTKAGLTKYQNGISGYVSYLNRSKDARSFSYPVFHEVNVNVPVFVKGVKNEYGIEMKRLKEKIKVAKRNAKMDIQGLKIDVKVKVAEAKEALTSFKAKIKEAKEQKRVETKACMDLKPKERVQCKQSAIVALEARLDEINRKMSQLPNVASLKSQYTAQITGAKSVVTDSDSAIELQRIKSMMSSFKDELNATRSTLKQRASILRGMRETYKMLKNRYTTNSKSIKKGSANEKELRIELRSNLGQEVKAKKKELDEYKVGVYNMKQGLHMIRLKMKKAVLNDYSPITMMKKKCRV